MVTGELKMRSPIGRVYGAGGFVETVSGGVR